ncbi:sigma-70 family RNA polymerase sigma factor [Spirosoma taeanense]|uniref:Sigma-70 family RNA polymerase sigma factor n=1 Tax=Spirosoma taeanense TaxID=2735870 RepID=A0A6M5Y8Q4_9BACT|nr:sigma-70 family RNA polymerase sigma factor [Spirosoma taeanense]QJW89884.1 sigma-70 family RNA polymerase sigma factor [Spirosoma taeanense]
MFRKSPSFAENDLTSVIRACRANDPRAQRTLFKQFFGYAKSICLRYTSNREEAEDVLNEGFLKVFQHLDRFDETQPFKAWLRTILVNTAISHYRRNQQLEQNTSLESGGQVAFNDDVVDQIAAEEILALVQQLSPTYRTVFMMHVVDGYSLHEIAGLLSHNEATVRSNYSRARQKLQQMIQKAYSSHTNNGPGAPIGYYEN